MQSARYRALDTSGLNHSSMEYAPFGIKRVQGFGSYRINTWTFFIFSFKSSVYDCDAMNGQSYQVMR